MQRKIIHIDADCFYAAIEMRDDPKLRGIPMAAAAVRSVEGFSLQQIMTRVNLVCALQCRQRMRCGSARI